MTMPLSDGFVDNANAANALSPYGLGPEGCEARHEQADQYTKRVWKAYHEEQALSAMERWHCRPVWVDSALWGDLLGGKLSEFIERERNNPRNFLRGGAEDRRNRRYFLRGTHWFICIW